MKKTDKQSDGEMKAEYDFKSMKGGVRGKYVKQYRAGTNLILLDPVLAKAFPTEAAVNEALLAVLKYDENCTVAERSEADCRP